MPSETNQRKKYKFLYPKGDYIYFRDPDSGDLTRLSKPIGCEQFEREHGKLLAAVMLRRAQAKAKPATPPPVNDNDDDNAADTRIVTYKPGTVGRGLLVYFGSVRYLKKTKSGTKRTYQRNAHQMRKLIGHAQLRDIDGDRVGVHAEDVAKLYGTSVGDAHVRLLSLVWKACKKYPEFALKGLPNPTDDYEKLHEVTRPHRPWTEAEMTFFMQTAATHLKEAKTFQHYLGQRGGDGIRVKWTDYDDKGIWITPEKTDRVPDPLPNYHLCPDPLRAMLDAMPRRSEYILTNSRGKPWKSASNLSRAIRDHLEKIGLWKKGRRNPSLHGFRKNMASEMAEAGVDTRGIKSHGGWKTDDMANWYAEHARQRVINANAVETWNAAMKQKKKRKLRVVG